MADQINIKGELFNARPSTAHYDAKGRYVHDPANQLLAEQQEQGLTGAREIAPHKHVISHAGYCALHLRLGCEAVECNQ